MYVDSALGGLRYIHFGQPCDLDSLLLQTSEPGSDLQHYIRQVSSLVPQGSSNSGNTSLSNHPTFGTVKSHFVALVLVTIT